MRRLQFVALFVCLLALLTSAHAQGVITTLAGTDWLFPGDGKPALNAPLSSAFGLDVITDNQGTLFICDYGNSMVMRVGANGILNVIAGNGYGFIFSGDGGLAVNAALDQPLAIAVDSSDNVYIAQYAGVIRKVSPLGIISTVATIPSGPAGDPTPFGIAVDSSGILYVADRNNNVVYKITPNGSVSLFAGGGTTDSDGIAATSAVLASPMRVAVDNSGNVYIADLQHAAVRKVDANGLITTVAGGLNNTNFSDNIPAKTATILPLGITLDAAGDLYIADGFQVGIRKVNPSGTITTVAGGSGKTGFSGDGGPALQAVFSLSTSSVAVDPAGNIYLADDGNARIRKVTPDGNINTVAGNGLFHFSGDNGLAVDATLDMPLGVIGDGAGNLYVTEPPSNLIRKIDANGVISVYAGTRTAGFSGDGGPATQAQLYYPTYMAIVPAGSPIGTPGALAFTDSLNCVVRQVDQKGIISTIAGTQGACNFTGVQPALKASFRSPQGIDFDSAGEMFIADTQENRLRIMFSTGQYAGQVFTLAGNGTAGYSGDGTNVFSGVTQVNDPVGVRVHNGAVYFADRGNNVIRRIDFASAVITTVAGNGKADYTGDGGPATKATLDRPESVNFDAQGNMYISDTDNSTIRKVDTNGIITTIAGEFDNPANGDGGPPSKAFVSAPGDLYFDANGNLIFAEQDTDNGAGRVREILFNTSPTVQATPGTLSFTAAANSPVQTQTIELTPSITGVPFTARPNSSGWLSIVTTAGHMPAEITVSVNPNLSPGTYSGSVVISAPNATPSTLSVPITLTVTSAGQPSLAVSPNAFTFPFVQGAPAQTRPLTISNAGGGALAFTVTGKTANGSNWLKVSQGSGNLSAFGSSSVNITSDPAGLAPGTYTGTITVASANSAQSVTVPVTMTITSVPLTILIPQTGLSFFAVTGGGSPPPQYFNILNTGLGQMPWTITTSTTSGGGWLTVFPAAGQTDASSPLVPQIRVEVNPAGLNPGTYSGTVRVNAPGATNNPQFVSVVLTVLTPGSTLPPIVQPVGLIFTGVAGGGSPGSQNVTVQTTNLNGVSFTSGIVTADGGSWLSSLPSSGTVTPSQPATIVIQPQIDTLSAGVYRGSITLSFSDGTSRTVSVLLVLTPGTGSASQRAGQHADATGGPCTPKQLSGVFTLLPDNFSIPAGYPGQVAVSIIDNCANPMTTGGVNVTFSNGDPPVRLTSLKDGNWAGTWSPLRSASQITVTANASIPDQSLAGTFSIKGSLQSATALPLINPGGIANAASGATLLAPGSLVSVYGANLATSLTQAGSVPLPPILGSTSVVIAGQQAPLLFVSGGQVNAVVPYGIPVNTSQQVVSSLGANISVPQSVTFAPAAPGIFIKDFSTGLGAITNAAGQLSDASNPVKAGDTIVIYCTGLGEVTPAVPAGTPGPSNPLAYAVNPVSVTLGGQTASVAYAGLAPGLVIYQVNAVVPAGVTPGDQVPVIITSAGQQSAPVVISVR